MPLADIVSVSITRETGAVSRAGFGIAMFAADHVRFVERIRFYSDLDGISDDFATLSKVHKAATAYFSQSPRPVRMAVGRRQVDQVIATVDTVVINTDYTTTINGADFVFNSGATPTAITIALGLDAAINAGAEPVTSTDNLDGTYDLDADVTGVAFSCVVDSNQSIVITTPTETWTAAINAIKTASNEWYALAIDSRIKADQTEVAAWTEAQLKIFALSSDEADIPGTTDAADTTSIAALLKASSYARTFGIYHDLADGTIANDPWADMAWLGSRLTVDPDVETATWKFVTLAGVPVVVLDTTQYINIKAKNFNLYNAVGGRNITEEGVVSAAEFIDIITGIDWVQARMTEAVFGQLVNSKKIPYTDDGIAVIETAVREILKVGIDTQFLAFDEALGSQGFLVTVPAVANVSTADKAARILKNVKFSATVAGAIHVVQITGTVSV